jgi:hypothetical protein
MDTNPNSETIWRSKRCFDPSAIVPEYLDKDDRLFSPASIAGQWTIFQGNDRKKKTE